MKRLYVTIDTEMDSNRKWEKKFPPTYSSVLEGIPNIYRPIWDELGVKPIYFVSPEVLYDEKCCKVLKDEIDKGAIIGAHLHPEYIEPNIRFQEGMELYEAEFPCFSCDFKLEAEKIKNLTNLIIKKLNIQPVWYRAARFGADADTMEILKEIGYLYDSSYTPGISWVNKNGPDHSKVKRNPYEIIEGIMEYPITIHGKRFGLLGKILPSNWLFYKWLRPTHMTAFELKSIIRAARKKSENELVMMFHSMEIMPDKTPYVRNSGMQKYYIWRLKNSLRYAKKMGYEL